MFHIFFCWSLIDGLASFERIASLQSERLRELQWEETRQPFVKVVKCQTENLKPPREFWVFGCFLILVHHSVLKLDFFTLRQRLTAAVLSLPKESQKLLFGIAAENVASVHFVAANQGVFVFFCLSVCLGPKVRAGEKWYKMDEHVFKKNMHQQICPLLPWVIRFGLGFIYHIVLRIFNPTISRVTFWGSQFREFRFSTYGFVRFKRLSFMLNKKTDLVAVLDYTLIHLI